MKLVVFSPEAPDPREIDVIAELFARGLERYHVRKPHEPRPALAAWLTELPAEWRKRMVLHQHHELVDTLGLGGRHFRAVPASAGGPPAPDAGQRPALPGITSRSCHELAALRSALGRYDAVFFGPVFPSISKPGYGPRAEFSAKDVAALLASRSADEQRRTDVLALGGVTSENIAQCRALGFDGVAVLGAVWHASDPVAAFANLQEEILTHVD
ncbi:MAG TPA: thiamine phosphate synthase [Opitutaceae bacterium]